MVSNWVDVVVLGIVAWNVATTVRRGFLAGVADLLVFVLSISIALVWNGALEGFLTGQLGIPSLYSQPLAFVLIWVVAITVLSAVAGFVVHPFNFLFAWSPIDFLLSVLPGAAKGFAVAGFLAALMLAPPALFFSFAPSLFTEIRPAIQTSQWVPRVEDALSQYEALIHPLLLAGPGSGTLPDIPSPGSREGGSSGNVPVPRPVQQPPAARGTTVTVQGLVHSAGWTPPGLSEVTLCTINYGDGCVSVATDNLGRFSFPNVPAYQSLSVKVESGIAICTYDKTSIPAWWSRNTADLGLLNCWQ